MSWFIRIGLFLLTNIAIIAIFMLVTSLLGIDTMYLKPNGLDLTSLAIVSLFFGFIGSFVSLLLSKPMAKWTMGVKIIDEARTEHEMKLVNMVGRFAQAEGIGMPQVGIYPSAEVNAFATGWNKNNSLVAVSQGLLDQMTDDEIEGVVAHEVAHVSNGDMVTMALLQGVINAFVIFFARAAAWAVQRAMGRDNEEVGGLAYIGLSILFEILFGILASLLVMKFSRYREFRADYGGARLAGKQKMIAALQKLQHLHEYVDTSQKSYATMKISDKPSRMGLLFASHPPLEKRIEALQMAMVN